MSPRPNRGGGPGRGSPRRRAPSGCATAGAAAGAGLAAAAGVAEAVAALLGPDWIGRPFLALDFETTGLAPIADRVVEVGALRFVPMAGGSDQSRITLKAEGSLASLVNPGIHIPAEVVAIHGIRDEDVARSPSFAAIAPALMALASGANIVAHNAPFDLSFLRAELLRNGFPAPGNAVTDTRILARRAFPGLPSYSLVNLSSRFGIDAGRSHRALDDAHSCMELMLRCAELCLGCRGEETA